MLRKALFAFLLCLTALPALAQLTYLPRSTPEEVGLRSADVLQFTDTMMRQKTTDMHGVMVLRKGKVVAEKYNEPYAPQYCHAQYSCSKTFTGIAVGLAIQDSLLHLEDRLVDFFPEMLPEVVSDSLAAITVRDLLTMQSGLPINTKMRTIETEWIRAYLAQPMVALPGTRFGYDSIDSYLLSAIVQKVTGQTVHNLLVQRIFTPLGITQVAWEQSPEGITCGGWGLYMQLESMAKFGQLILQRGEWDGQQLVSAEWIDAMLQHYSTNTNGQRYGYHIWLTSYPGMVKCDGAWGQFIYIIPDKQMVVAMTQCSRGNTNYENKAVWDLSRSAADVALPASNDYKTLQMARYRLTPTRGNAFSRRRILNTQLNLGSNILNWKSVSLDLSQQQTHRIVTLKVTTLAGETFDIVCEYQKWRTSEIKGLPLNIRAFQNNFSNIRPPFYVGASYGWTSDDDLYVRLHYVNWFPSCRLHFRFQGDAVAVDILTSETEKSRRISTTIMR